ncbi:ANTAR domain-containing protein [Rhodococcus rhodnii]|uniref:ANTAR domain-containing protein n=2 Tax=Rhodococcus rhodnii TaxID=38312 RepID=A0A6P2CEJ3_9NOCA|nr:GAF and ANTAR domain-containing protein [Rhodococcus rhodnii]EOM78347.1 putative RNA binding sensor regulator [Rhodococcus rhodnii LMG 5362]TXG91184.1 ANTAR domain-containing protein [Rhodococcus rhodnii]
MRPTSEKILRELAEHARDWRLPEQSLDDLLREITRSALALIPGCESVDVLMIEADGTFTSRAATSESVERLDALQISLGEGPCVAAATAPEAATTVSQDMNDETRWPRFARAAAEAGVGSMVSVRLYTREGRIGALNVVAPAPGAFDDDAIVVAESLAAHAASTIVANTLEHQLRSAVASRDVIGQAKDMIMERYGLDAAAAFRMLSGISQNTNSPLIEVARTVVEHSGENA